MEANQKKFVCKFCSKTYPCGKSLGGHIRIHLNGSSTEITEETNLSNLHHNNNYINNNQSQSLGSSYNNGSSIKRDFSGPSVEALVAGQSGYGLRENPKKTKRFVLDLSNTNLLGDKVCKECGKGFQSLKALCGHMACHSRNNNNNNNLEDHYFGTSEKLKELVMDGQSDTETSAPSKRRRSERVRYKARCVYSSSANGSFSSGSDVEQEQEEVAKCLMMLSRDSSFKGCFSSNGDSSDNNSVVLETKSSYARARRLSVKNGGADLEFDDNGVSDMKKAKQRESVVSVGNENDESESSDSGYFTNGPRKVELDASANWFGRNDEFKKCKVELRSGFGGEFDSGMGKRLSRFRHVKAELQKNLVEDGSEVADRDLVKNGFCNPDLISRNAPKRGKSLVGDQFPNQKRTNGFISYSKNVGFQNGVNTNNVPSPLPSSSKNIKSSSGKNLIQQNSPAKAEKKLGSRKGKMHECPFCSKVFRSGQALGGHKRSHFVGSAEDRTLVIKEDVPEISMPALIDLNLPAPVEEGVDGCNPW